MSVADKTSIIVAFFTAMAAFLLIWYTVETRRLRKATQKLLAESERQNANIEKQNENLLLPILFPGAGEMGWLVVRNVGSGPAFNIEIEPINVCVGVTNVAVTFKPKSNSIVQGESQSLVIDIWINSTLTNVNSTHMFWQTLANIDPNFSDEMAISYDSANEEHHRIEFALTVWPELAFVFKHRTRTRHHEPEKAVCENISTCP